MLEEMGRTNLCQSKLCFLQPTRIVWKSRVSDKAVTAPTYVNGFHVISEPAIL
jgi:hypothetical protein